MAVEQRLRTESVLRYFGTARQVAEALKISVQAVYDWGEFVPELRAIQLHSFTNGKLWHPNIVHVPHPGIGIPKKRKRK